MIWPSIRRKLDKDRETYEEKCRSASYSAAVKTAKANGQPIPDREVFDAAYNKKHNIVTRKPTEQEFEQLREDAIRKLINNSFPS